VWASSIVALATMDGRFYDYRMVDFEHLLILECVLEFPRVRVYLATDSYWFEE
jgi:hypothetical protein